MKISRIALLAFAFLIFIYIPGQAQLTESLYVSSSTSSMPIDSAANCLGAPDGSTAMIDSNLANYENWTFNFDNTAYPESTLISAQLYMTHNQVGLVDDSLIIEYFYGADSVIFKNFADVPTTLTTDGPYSLDSILTTSQVDSFRVRMLGVQHTEPPEHIEYFVDAMELRVTYEVNEYPVLSAVSAQNVAEGDHLEVRISATDPDPGDVVTLTAENLPLNASFVDSSGGIGGLTFDPDYTQSGPYQVRIIATDTGGYADTQLVDIAVTNVDLPPVIDPITPPTIAEGGHLDLRVTASDPDGDAITLTAEFTSANMAFTDSSGGVGGLTFDPDYTQSGNHQVRFIATSNLLADTQLVDITVTNVDLPPVIDPITPPTLAEGEHLDLLVTASDPDGDAITLTAEYASANMAFTDSSGGVGGLTFDPDYTQSGIHQVRFIATSNTLADTQLVDITVTNVDLPPALDLITPPTLAEAEHLDLRVTASDSDGDAITLTAEFTSANMAFADSSGGVGGLTFDPDYTQSGIHQVRFIATSNALADTQIVNITVTNVDLPPAIDPITPPTLAEGEHLDLRITASDPDGDAITLTAEFTSANMAFADSSGGVGGLTFDPDYSQSGSHQVRFIATSTTLADTQIVNITVTETDRAPVLDPITPPTLAEGEHLDLRVTASDPDGDAITLTAEFTSANMAYTDSSGGVGGLTFDPDYTQSGIHQVRFIATSNALADTQIVNITVTNVDLPPSIDPITPPTLAEGEHLDLRVTASDPDGDAITLTAEFTSGNMAFTDSSGGVGGLTFDPDYTQSGNHQVRFIATSNTLADTQLVNITVTNVDLPPSIDPITPPTLAEGEHLDLRVTASDPDGDAVTFVAEFTSANMAFADSSGGVGGLTFDPDYTQSGNHQVRFIATSNTLADTQIVNITVTNVDLPPALDPITPPTLAEGEHLDLRVTASDPDGDAITLTAEFTSANMAFADSSGGVGGLTFDPDYTQSGVHQVRFIATSNALADTQIVNIIVTNVDLPPAIDPITPPSIAEGGHLDLRVTASDPDGDAITLTAEFTSANMAFADSSGGVGGLTFDPDYTQSGSHQVRFIATSTTLVDTQIVNITVTETDRPPVLDPITPPTLAEGEHLDLRVTASDPDGDAITLTAEFTSANMAFTDSSGGVGGLTFDPDYTQSGIHQVRFIATSNALADTQLVNITVTNVDLPPSIDPITPPTLAEGEHLDLRVTASDPDGDAITLTAEFTSANMAFTDSSGGVGGLTFDPDYTQSGNHQVRFIATSNTLADTQLVDITVTNVDLPPAIDPITPPSLAEAEHLDLRVTASDPDGDAVTFTAEFTSANMAFTDSSGGVGGLTFDPDYTQSGNHQVRFIATSNTLADTQLVDITVTNVDLPPAIDPITPPTLAEGEHLDLRVTASDPDGDAITLTAVFTSANMAFTDSSGGVGGLTFDPDYTQSGVHQVRFIATSNALADTQIVNITVTNVDLPPAIDPITPPTLAEGEHLDLRITASDPDGDAITLTAEFTSANMAFADSSGGVGGLTFDPDYSQSGIHQVRFIAVSNALADTQLVDITVTQVDLPPVIDPVSPQSVDENGHLDVRVTASDFDGDPVTLSAENLPSNAAFADSSGGVGGLTFDPDYFQAGDYTVRIIASSTTLADTGFVDITVNNVDRSPILSPIGNRSVLEGNTLTLLISASDPDLEIPSLTAENLPVNAVFVDSSNGKGSFIFSPDYTQSGNYNNIRFIASDGVLADSETITVTVYEAGNQAPQIDSIGPQTVQEGLHLELLVTANDPDSTIPILQAFNLPANADFADSGNGNGSFTFDPDFTQANIYNVLFRAYDGGLYDSLWVEITVPDSNRAPVLAAIGAKSVTEGDTLDFVVTASDIDGTTPALSAEGLPLNAVFEDSSNGHGLFFFTPDFTQAGTDTVLFIASDGQKADSEFVEITVSEFGNNPPILAPIGPQSVDEGSLLQVLVSAADADSTIPVLSAEDLPPGAAFTDSLNGTGLLEYSPDYFQAGLHTVRFIASDGTAADTELVDITVNNINRTPVLDPILTPQAVDEGDSLLFSVTASDVDLTTPALTADGLPANATFADSGNGIGYFRFLPDYFQSGSNQILFIASDGDLADSQYVDITVNNVNRAPVLNPIATPQSVPEGDSLLFTVTTGDPDLTTPTLTAEGIPTNATFFDNGDGTGDFRFLPDFGQAGPHQVLFITSDGSLADSQYVDINVTNTDRAPALDPLTPPTIAEGDHLDLRVTASDPDGDAITLTAEFTSANMAFVDSSGGTGGLTFDPDYTQSGNHQVRFIASSNTLADTQLVDITVTNVDLPPTIDPITPPTLAEGGHLDLRVTASDPDGDAITLTAEFTSANLAFVDSTGGVGGLTFDPDFTQSGIHQVRFIAASNALADTQLVNITVTDVDLPPALAAIPPQGVNEGGHLEFQVTATDLDGDSIALTAELLVTNMAFVDSTGGVGGFTFDPDSAQSGFYQVRFIATSNSLADTQLVDITVGNVDLPPAIDPITPPTLAEGDHLDLRITASDPDGDAIALTAEFTSANMAFVDSTGGVGGFTFDPDYTQSGIHQVRFIATSNALADTQLVDITVLNTNLAPVLDPISTPQSVPEGDSLSFIVTASDPDLTTPSLTAENLPANATFIDNGDGTGDLLFLPDYFQAGLYPVLFIASDGSLADSQSVDINVTNVNRAPVLDPIPTPRTVVEGDSLLFTVTSSDPDLTTPTLSAAGLPVNATFTNNGDGTGDFRFLPDFTQSGPHQVLFIASDGTLTDSQYVDITVTELNLPPVLDSIPTPRTVAEGDSLIFTVSASDPDLTIPSLSASGLPANATFADSGNGVGYFRFLPDYTQSGPNQVLFVASDGNLADSQYVDITVTDVNLPPVLDPIVSPQNVNENDILSLRITGSDPDGTIPSLTAIGLPVNAAFVDSSNGAGGLVFTPDYTQAGTYPVWFIASDGILADSQSVDIIVADINAPPVITVVGPQSVNEDDSLLFTVSGSDIDGALPSLTVFNNPLNSTFTDSSNGTGLFDFRPDYTQSGLYSVGFVASDGFLADTGYVDITVTNINLPVTLDSIPTPQSVDEGDSLLFTVTASDPDGPPSIVAEGLPPNATLNDNGDGTADFRFLPDYSQSGPYQILFYATDGATADSQFVDITVNHINLPPVLDPIGPQAVDEADSLLLTITASDFDGTIPGLSALGVPTNASFIDNGDGTGSFRFDPDYFQADIYNVTFIATDGVLADTEVVEITVNDTPRPPVLNPISDRSMFEGQTISFRVTSTDPDSTYPSLSVVNLPINATFTDSLNGNGLFTFSPNFTQSGIYDLIFIASDSVLADSDQVRITVYETGDQPPVIDSIGPQTVVEGEHLEFLVTATDPEGVVPALQSFNRPNNSTFTDFGDGSGLFTFDPSFTQSGVYNVLFRAFDGALYDSLWVEITVVDFDLSPVLDSIGPKSVTEGDTLSFVVTATDPDGTIPVLSAAGVPLNASFVDSLNGHGLFRFIPDFNQSGIDTVLFIASDGIKSDSEYVQITIFEFGNNPPVLNPIGPQSVDEGSLLQVPISATDPDSTTPVLSAENLPVGASFVDSLNGRGLFEFTPDFSQAGLDTVRFIAFDGSLADTEIVEITVNNINRVPALDSIPTPRTVAEGGTLQISVTASDPDGTIPVLAALNLPPNASFFDSTNGIGLFTFNPDFTQSGDYQVLFIASDSTLADSQYVDITVTEVNRAPVLDPIISPQAVNENDTLYLRITGSDPDGNIPALSAVNIPVNSSFVDSSNGAGSFIFTPDYTQAAIYQVRFIASDGSLADSQLVNIIVTNINAPPVITVVGPQSVNEGDSLQFTVSGSDIDGTIPTLTVFDNPANSILTDSLNGTGLFEFGPDYTQAGLYSVGFIASDGLLADTGYVDITVTNINLPVALDSIPTPQSVDEGDSLLLTVTASDPDGPPALFADSLPVNAAFVDNGDGTADFRFLPDYSQSGPYQVLFYATDGVTADSQFVDIAVNQVNLPPVLDPIGSQAVDEADSLIVNISASDFDGTIPILSALDVPANASFVDNNDGTGRFRFDPDYFQAGVYNVTFIASDGALSDSETVAVTVNDTPRSPVIQPISDRSIFEGQTVSFMVYASDPDLTVPILSALNVPVNASFTDSLNGRGFFTFSPDYTQSGTYVLTFIASDGVLADSEVVNIFVFEVGNLPPEIAPIPPQTVIEGQHLEFVVSASDPDSTTPALQGLNLPPNATFADSGNGHGLFTFDPDYTQAGVDTVLFRAFDGQIYDSLYVEITVIDFGFPPVLDSIGPQSVTEGQTLQVLISASDPDGTTPQLLAEQLPANAVFEDSLNGSGLLTFTPNYIQSGADTVLFIATDGALSDSEYVEITIIEAGNQPPVLGAVGPQTVAEGDTLIVVVTGSDPDSTIPLLSASGLPANATFTDNFDGTGSFEFYPDYTQAGVDTVLFVAADSALADSEYVEITIYNVNLPPVLTTIAPQTVNEGDTLQLIVTATDPDGNIPSLFADSLPVNSSFVDSANGTGLFEFMPDYTQAGVYNVLFIAYDGVLTDSQFVEVTVQDVNLPPVFDPVSDQQVVEADSLFFTVQATDPEGLTPSLSVDSLLSNSVFTDNGDGTGLFEYRPDYTQSGVDTVIFIADDGILAESLKVQVTTIEVGNQPPVLDPIGSQMVDEGQQLQFNIYASDVDGPPPALDVIQIPANSFFDDSSNGVGTFTFNPDYTQAGTYNVLFVATDGDLADSENVEIVVNNVNQVPVLSPIGTQTISEGDSLGLNISAVDLDGDSLIMTADPLEPNMTFVDSGSGSAFFQFMPDYSQSGIYYVTFTVTDSVDADTEFVQINVSEAGNQAPVLAPIDSAYFITEGFILDIPISAYDLDNDSLILSADSLVENMSFVDYGDGTGLFNFSPSYLQSGDYTVTFRVFDGLVYDSATTFIHVAEEGNQPPVLDPIGPQTVPEGESLVVDVSATDPEGAIPLLYVAGEPDSSYFVDYGDGTGRFVFYPDYYDAGLDTVRFSAVDDGGFADYEDVIITITDVNLPPLITFTGDTVVHQGDTTLISILVTDSSDFQPGAISLSHGYIPLNSMFTVTGNNTAELLFYPDFSQIGADSALVIATDGDNPPLTDRRWIHFVVTQTNRAPVFPTPDPGIVNEGDTLVMNISATDPDGDSLIMFINCDCPEPLPSRSEFRDFGDGTAQFTFYPDFTQSGIYIIYFAASDGDITVTRPTFVQVVEMGNQVPTLNTIGPLSVLEGDTLDVHITSTDPDSTIGTYSLEGTVPWNLVFTDSSNNSASMHIEPIYNQSGVYNMLVIFTDRSGAADSEYVDLTIVEAGNQAPQLDPIADRQLSEGEIVEFLVQAVDPDSTIPTLIVHNMPVNASFADSGNGIGYFVFTPDFFQAGVYPITFLAVDSEDPALADSTIVTITVNDVNRSPVIDPVGPFSLNEGDTLIFDVISHDPDSTTPNLVALSPPRNSTFINNGDGTGTFTFTPDFFQAGLDSVRFLAVDSTDPTIFVTLTVNLEVFDVNRAPVLSPIPDTVVGDGFMLTLPITSMDPDSTVPTLFQRSMPDSASFTDFGDGTGVFQWRPRFEDIGLHNITFGCIDQFDPSLADSQIVVIEVITSGNHPPVFVPTPDQMVNALDTLDLLIQAVDPEGDGITINPVDTLPTGMVFVDSGGGVASLFWVPTYDQSGDHMVTLVAADDSLLTDTTRINITVRTYVRGDANGDGSLNGLDVIYLVTYFKGGGPPPNPIEAGDANGDGTTNGLDVIYLVAYFKGVGPPPPPESPGSGGGIDASIKIIREFR